MSSEEDSSNSNLKNFLDSITPIVEKRYLEKDTIKYFNDPWNPNEKEPIEYFSLADLWHKYSEWSAYGVGAKIRLNHGESVIQYYAPYLSAVQIYTSNMNGASYRDLFNDNHKRNGSENEKIWARDKFSSHDGALEEGNLSNLDERLGHLYFQYFERASPYERVPLSDKVTKLAEKFPGLVTLKSTDLSSMSWISVAWYPIYHIPAGRAIKDLSACFLTYHTLSSSFINLEAHQALGFTGRKKNRSKIIIPPFGLATYKLHGSVWSSKDTSKDRDKLISLYKAADSWLKDLRVQQHDFDFFSARSYY